MKEEKLKVVFYSLVESFKILGFTETVSISFIEEK